MSDRRPDVYADAPMPTGRLDDTWCLDELFVTIRGRRRYLWRAVDEDGDMIDIILESRRDRRAFLSEVAVDPPLVAEDAGVPRVGYGDVHLLNERGRSASRGRTTLSSST